MDYAAVAVVLSAVFMLGFVVGVVFGRWVPENRPEIHVATLDELRRELRSLLDEGWTEQQLIDWKETVGEAFREATKGTQVVEDLIVATTQTAEQMQEVIDEWRFDREKKSTAESALKGLAKQVERLDRWVMATPVAGFSTRIEKLEGAASEFHQRIGNIEERLRPTASAVVNPHLVPKGVMSPTAVASDDEEVIAGVTQDPAIALVEQAFANWERGEFGDPWFVKNKPVDRLGWVLQRLRQRANLSAKHAGQIGVSDWGRISQIENFSSVPTDDELRRMLGAYAPPSHLLSKIWRLWGECGQVANEGV